MCRSRGEPLRQPDERLTASRVAPRDRRDKWAAKSQPTARACVADASLLASSDYSANHPGESVHRVMTTHPTSLNAGLTDGERTVRGAGHVPDLRSGLRKRATGRDDGDDLAALTTVERHRHKLEKTR